jgi:hypothetical protein
MDLVVTGYKKIHIQVTKRNIYRLQKGTYRLQKDPYTGYKKEHI